MLIFFLNLRPKNQSQTQTLNKKKGSNVITLKLDVEICDLKIGRKFKNFSRIKGCRTHSPRSDSSSSPVSLHPQAATTIPCHRCRHTSWRGRRCRKEKTPPMPRNLLHTTKCCCCKLQRYCCCPASVAVLDLPLLLHCGALIYLFFFLFFFCRKIIFFFF